MVFPRGWEPIWIFLVLALRADFPTDQFPRLNGAERRRRRRRIGPTSTMDQQAMIDMALAQTLLSVEAAVDQELEKASNLDEDDYARIRAKRFAEMKKKQEQAQMNRHNGHGSLTKIVDQQEFFAAAKNSERLICIFNRNSNKWGKNMIDHCELLAQRHLEARFVWVDAENAPFLTDRLNIYMLPTIVCVKDNKVHKQHNGLDEIDGTGKYTSGMLEHLLHIDDMLDESPLYDKEIQEEEEFDIDEEDAEEEK